jgi:UDP:flavonoid glycosyltransferase YjiC (YdhE family)
MARIVLNTFGSFGDLHPFLAIAIELRCRGHTPVIATSEIYRAKVEAEGVEFAAIRPDVGKLLHDQVSIEGVWHPVRGTEYLLKKVILPYVEESFEDLESASRNADLLITHSAALAGPIVAEKLKLPWLSAALQPMVFFSLFDPPVLGPVPWLRHMYSLGHWPFATMRALARRQLRQWIKPILYLRNRLGLDTRRHPMFEGQFSPSGTLALFSKSFATPQPDWPPNVAQCGFVFYDCLGASPYADLIHDDVAKNLSDFLSEGSPPVVFTLGSSAVMSPGEFFAESLAAARSLGVRAVLLTGALSQHDISDVLPDSVFVAPYAAYSMLLPRALVTVHHGGIGTTAQALDAGRPMLVVPWGHDQADNAERLRKLGVARTLRRKRYTAATVARELRMLQDKLSYAETAAVFHGLLSAERGALAACDQIERCLAHLPLLAH